MSARTAVLVLFAATLLGLVGTLVLGQEPGFLLGLFITVGAVAATLGVRRGAVYRMFPLPAFAFFVAAVIAGKIHDGSLTSSTTGLGVGFLQWIADIFFPMAIATVAVLVVGGIRWLLAYQLIVGQFPMSDGRVSASHGPRPAPNPGRPEPVIHDSWAGRAAGGPRAPRTGPGAARPDRRPGDQGTDRWGDPRQPAIEPRSRDGRAPAPAPGRGPGAEPRGPRFQARPPGAAQPPPDQSLRPVRPPQSPRDPR